MNQRAILIFRGGLIASIICCFLVWSIAYWFDWFKIRTAHENIKLWNNKFAPSELIQTPIVWLALAHLSLGKWQLVVSQYTKWGSVFGLLHQQRALLSIPLNELLNKPTQEERKRALDAHMRHLEIVYKQSVDMKDELLTRAKKLQEESSQCLEKKRAWDTQFFQGVQWWQDPQVKQWLAQSLEFAPCYITKRIESNAAAYLWSYLVQTLPLLQQRNQLLKTHYNTLIQHYELLSSPLLDELRMVKQQMNWFQVPTEEDMGQIFNMWSFTESSVLPTFSHFVVFPKGQIPNFQNPWIWLTAP